MRKKVALYLILLFCLSTISQSYAQNTSGSLAYGFIENKGQIIDQSGNPNNEVLYLLPLSRNLNIQLKRTGFSYDVFKSSGDNRVFQRIDIALKNANENPEIISAAPAADYINYYTSGLRGNEAYKTSHYQSVTYKEVYPNIDLKFTFQAQAKNRFKFDFILYPGADINDIQLEYKGFSDITVADKIAFTTVNGILTESIPKSWKMDSKEEISVNYILLKEQDNLAIFGFQTNVFIERNHNGFVIDPDLNLNWGTYYGDVDIDEAVDVMTDNLGDIYMTGNTQSLTNLATSGVHQDTMAGGFFDVFILKTSQNSIKQWSTYYGGTGEDLSTSIMVDTFRNVTITGKTNSPDGIPSNNCHQALLNGTEDAFIAQFNQDGMRNWSTYYGGAGEEYGLSVDTDYDGFVYIAGVTANSSSGLASGASHQNTNAGGSDGYLAKFDTSGTLLWSSYYGGSAQDTIFSIAQEGNNIMIAGVTNSPNNIATVGSHKENPGGALDAFIACFDQSGARNWGTYYGDTEDEGATDVEIYNTRVYCIGYTNSDTSIATTNAYKTSLDSTDAFLVKFDTLGNRMWGTYFGGESYDIAVELGIELDSNIYIFGNTYSATNLASPNNYDTTYNGASDAFVARFHYNGYFQHATYYGGDLDDVLTGGDVYGNTAIYLCGRTISTDSIALNTYIQDSLAGMEDAFLTRFITDRSTQCTGGTCNGQGGQSGGAYFCQDSLLLAVSGGALGAGANWVWYEGDCGPPGNQIGIGDSIWYYPPLGSVTIYVRAESINNTTACSDFSINVVPLPTVSVGTNDTILCVGDSLQLNANGGLTYNWIGPNAFTSNLQDPVIDSVIFANTGSYEVMVTDSLGCYSTDSVAIVVNENPFFNANISAISCQNWSDGSIQLSGTGNAPLLYNWSPSVSTDTIADSLMAGLYVVTLTDSNQCSYLDSLYVPSPPSFIDTILVTAADCLAKNGALDVVVQGNSNDYTYQWTPFNQTTPTINNLNDGTYTVEVTDSIGCAYQMTAVLPNQNNLNIDTVLITDEGCYGDQDGAAEIVVGSGQAPFSYNWGHTGQNSPIVQGLSQGVYYFEVTDGYGCIRNDSIVVSGNDSISLLVDSLGHAICDKANGWIAVSANGGSGDFSYSWQPSNDQGQFIINLATGSYSVTVTDSVGCHRSETIEIIAIPTPTVSIIAQDSTIDLGDSLSMQANVTPAGTYEYFWTPSIDLDCDSCQIVMTQPTTSTLYNVTIVDTNGCEATSDLFIIVNECKDYFLPTVFSPNGDQLNDDWNVLCNCIKSYKLQVFNRWGEEIFSTDSQSQSWDGTYKGRAVDMGSYNYQIALEYVNGETTSASGNVKVVR